MRDDRGAYRDDRRGPPPGPMRPEFDRGGPPPPGAPPGGTPIVMVYHLPTVEQGAPATFTHDMVYNLFSVTGDVLRVRLLSKPANAAMVEMGTPQMVSDDVVVAWRKG